MASLSLSEVIVCIGGLAIPFSESSLVAKNVFARIYCQQWALFKT
jgi:hypothetical protein